MLQKIKTFFVEFYRAFAEMQMRRAERIAKIYSKQY
jgi:hypothetical protein